MSAPKRTLIGVAWYQPVQWPMLLAISEDGDQLSKTYDEWHRELSKFIQEQHAQGVIVQKVPLNLEQWAEWCRQNKKPFNGASRAEYITLILRSAGQQQQQQ